jgi:hypothetical protein
MDLRSTPRTARLTGLLALGLLAAGLTGCGSDDDTSDGFVDQDVDKIQEQVFDDMHSASSLTMSGTATNDDSEISLELSSDTDGNCTGTVSMGQGSSDFIRADGATFIRGDEEFWRATAGAQADDVLSVVGSKWAKLPGGDNQFAEFCDLDNFLEQLESGDDKGAEKGETTEIDGEEALEITFKEDGGTTHVWVATEGKHYILKFNNDGEEPGEFTFSDFDEPVDAEAPDESEYVDLSKLG